MNKVRGKAGHKQFGSGAQHVYNDDAGAIKAIGGILGKLIPMGALDTAKVTPQFGRLVAVLNTSEAIAYVKTGLDGVTAPTDGTDGIGVLPMQYTILALGDDSHIIGDAAGAELFAYLIEDDSYATQQ